MPQARKSGQTQSLESSDPAYLDLGHFLASRTIKRACTASLHILFHLYPVSRYYACHQHSGISRGNLGAKKTFPADNNDRTLTSLAKFEDELRVIGILTLEHLTREPAATLPTTVLKWQYMLHDLL